MISFLRKIDTRRKTYLKLAGSIEGQLREAYALRHEQDGLTQQQIADSLGINRSAVHRRLSGRLNMTILTIADLVWALDHDIRVSIVPNEKHCDGNKPAIGGTTSRSAETLNFGTTNAGVSDSTSNSWIGRQ